MHRGSIDYKNALDEFKGKLKVSLSLAFTHSQESLWVFSDKVLEADHNLGELFESKATINIIIAATHDDHHLW